MREGAKSYPLMSAFPSPADRDLSHWRGLVKSMRSRAGCRRRGANRSAEPSRRAQASDVHDIVDHWVHELSDKQRAVVERRFGLHGYRRATLEQIGHEIGVTRERVRQIQLDALKNLREMLESNGISGDALLD